jgi:hypothetical protein
MEPGTQPLKRCGCGSPTDKCPDLPRTIDPAEVDPDAPNEPRQFLIRGTGHLFEPTTVVYVGTAQIGAFVWHVYEATPMTEGES